MKKKYFASSMAGMFALAIMAVPAMAKPVPMASVNGVEFNTLTEAIQVANQYPGSTIEILSDATYGTTMLTFEDVTINMNGYTITRTNSEARWMVGGIEEPEDLGGEAPETLPVVVINGGEEGSLITDAEDVEGEISTPLITAQYADITINNVTMVNTMIDDDASAFCLRDAASATLNDCDLSCCCGIKVYREYGTGTSSLTINGGTITSECTEDAVWKGSAVLAEIGINYDVNIEINDAVLTSTNTAALVLSPECHTTIKDSTLSGATGIYYKAGELNIENSVIEGTGEYVESPATGKEVNTTISEEVCFDGSGILVDSDNKFGETLPITISDDSTVSSANGYGIREIGGVDGTGVSLVDLQADGAEISGALGDIALLEAAE